jgi:thioesterase domain-containing protein
MNHLFHSAFTREVLRKVTDVILPLNEGGAGTPIYCVHSVTGVATDLRFLAEMLGPKQRFYGIQMPSKNRNGEFVRSIESISRYYVDALVRFQPDGTIMLGGNSTGAIIALEMAQQLRLMNREVSLLVVFDGELFNTGAEFPRWNPVYWLKLIFNLNRWFNDIMLAPSFWPMIRNRASATRKAITEKISGAPQTGHRLERFINLTDVSPDHRAFMISLFEAQFAYLPKIYLGRVLVFSATTQGLLHLRQVKEAWRAIAPFSEIVKIKGTHTSILRERDGRALANHLAMRIEGSRSSVDRV